MSNRKANKSNSKRIDDLYDLLKQLDQAYGQYTKDVLAKVGSIETFIKGIDPTLSLEDIYKRDRGILIRFAAVNDYLASIDPHLNIEDIYTRFVNKLNESKQKE